MTDREDALLQFPCSFPIKAMGRNESGFVAHVLGLVAQHFPDVAEKDINIRPSRGKKYLSVTVTVTATSKLQLDTTYSALTDSEQVIMAL